MTDPDRGRVPLPDLDDRTWQDLVEEMQGLIEPYAPAWTDSGPGDIGIALIELFAWLAEGIVYRLNKVPEKSYIAFVNLLGITRDPASPAHTFLTFATAEQVGAPVDVPAGTQAQTAPTGGDVPVVFETDAPVRVLPTNLRTAVLVTPDEDDELRYQDRTPRLVGPPATSYRLTLPDGATTMLCLGFDAATPDELELGVRLNRPLGDLDDITVAWAFSQATSSPQDWPGVPDTGVVDGTGGLAHNGSVRLRVPAAWTAQRPSAPPGGPPPQPTDPPSWADLTPLGGTGPVSDVRFWVALRIDNQSGRERTVDIDRLLFNAAPASTASTLRAEEILGTSDGSPHQVFPLVHRPLHRGPDPDVPYPDLRVEIGTGTPPVWRAWTAVEDFPEGPAPVYRADGVTAEIGFGDHDAAHPQGSGSIPPAGAVVRARYRHVTAGAAGNVTGGEVTLPGTTLTGELPSGIASVVNLAGARDGADEEPVAETLRRAPEHLRIRDRAVTAEDYEFLAGKASTDVAICRCLPPRLSRPPAAGALPAPYAFGGINRSPGTVSVVVVPDQGPDVARPEPTPELLRDVRSYLDERRDLAAALEVTGPRYLPVIVDAEITTWPQAQIAGVTAAVVTAMVRDRIAAFLHPTRGGPDGAGWQVGQHVFTSDLFRAIMPPADVGFLSRLTVRAGTPVYGTARPFGAADAAGGASVRLADYELVCAALPDEHHITVLTEPA